MTYARERTMRAAKKKKPRKQSLKAYMASETCAVLKDGAQ
jgi:hypothetical protein